MPSTTSTEVRRLTARGQQLYTLIHNQLTPYSRFIREHYRREEDFQEMCIALALLERYFKRTVKEEYYKSMIGKEE